MPSRYHRAKDLEAGPVYCRIRPAGGLISPMNQGRLSPCMLVLRWSRTGSNWAQAQGGLLLFDDRQPLPTAGRLSSRLLVLSLVRGRIRRGVVIPIPKAVLATATHCTWHYSVLIPSRAFSTPISYLLGGILWGWLGFVPPSSTGMAQATAGVPCRKLLPWLHAPF
ncbi:hypothetical protein GGI43DRAFT_237710 [Trichoderma evansii]